MIRVVGVRTWAIVVGFAVVAALPTILFLALREPSPPAACRDSIIAIGYTVHECDHPDHRMEIKEVKTIVVVQCLCPRDDQ